MNSTIDPPIQRLVDALNAFDGIRTHGSCGGHPEPVHGGQWPAGSWYVKFRVDKSAHGWRALEFLAWLINNAYQRDEHHVTLYPVAPPPYLNTPGQVLSFALEGVDGEDPDALADWMQEVREGALPSAAGADIHGSARSTATCAAGPLVQAGLLMELARVFDRAVPTANTRAHMQRIGTDESTMRRSR